MTVRNLARVCNHFEPSDQAMAPDELLLTREVAALLNVGPRSILARAHYRNIPGLKFGNHRYWTPLQIEQLRGKP